MYICFLCFKVLSIRNYDKLCLNLSTCLLCINETVLEIKSNSYDQINNLTC